MALVQLRVQRASITLDRTSRTTWWLQPEGEQTGHALELPVVMMRDAETCAVQISHVSVATPRI